MNYELFIEVVGDENRGQELLELITDETGVGHEHANGAARFSFAAAGADEAHERVSEVLDREAGDWREHLSF